VYLINLQGKLVHSWQLPYAPGLSGYITERGTLLYNGRTSENNFLSRFPFKGGVVLEADWNSKVLWELRHRDHHHVGILLRNRNVLLNCLGTVPAEIARQVKGGREDHSLPGPTPSAQEDARVMYADYFAELTPMERLSGSGAVGSILIRLRDGIAEVQALRIWAMGTAS
jgi:hypothetical protein